MNLLGDRLPVSNTGEIIWGSEVLHLAVQPPQHHGMSII